MKNQFGVAPTHPYQISLRHRHASLMLIAYLTMSLTLGDADGKQVTITKGPMQAVCSDKPLVQALVEDKDEMRRCFPGIVLITEERGGVLLVSES